MRVSVAVPAYNEERNIGELLDSLRTQRTKRARIVEIVVIASGCTDRTAEIVRARAARPGVPVRLIEEPERRGKVHAINTYLRDCHPSVDAICVCSADLLINRDVGMCGGRPMPTNGHGTFTGEATRFLWHMHHRVALEAPKLGELVMVRAALLRSLPTESAVDEASIEQMVTQAGYRLAYVPEAIVHNHGPETVREFVRQRRRIAAGHLWLRRESGYSVATMNVGRIIRLTLAELLETGDTRRVVFSLGTIGLEAVSRGLGWFDFQRNPHKHAIWKAVPTTKQVLTDEVRASYALDLESDELPELTGLARETAMPLAAQRPTGT